MVTSAHTKKIGVICWGKQSDAYIIRELEKTSADLVVVIYKIPARYWLSWLGLRIQRAGLMVLLGHLALSLWIRSERWLDRFHRRNLWKNAGVVAPAWKQLRTKINYALTETALIQFMSDRDEIILLDATRLSRQFFKQTRPTALQVVWGLAPTYLGDSGGFWAYAQGNLAGTAPTLIRRSAQFHHWQIVATLPVAVHQQETIRSLKIKQVIEVAQALPKLLITPSYPKHQQKQLATFFYAPTLYTYLQFLKHRTIQVLPKYAQRSHYCTIEE